MLPFYDDKSDIDMIHITYYMKNLATKHDVRPTIKDTFWIEKLKNPKICNAIEGVIEYAIEEVEDDDLEMFKPHPEAKEESSFTKRSRSVPRIDIENKELETAIRESIINLNNQHYKEVENKHKDENKNLSNKQLSPKRINSENSSKGSVEYDEIVVEMEVNDENISDDCNDPTPSIKFAKIQKPVHSFAQKEGRSPVVRLQNDEPITPIITQIRMNKYDPVIIDTAKSQPKDNLMYEISNLYEEDSD